MSNRDRRGERTIALALLGAVMFSRPILDGFSLEHLNFVLGIPSLYLYLFGAWVVLIGLLALVMESHGNSEKKRTNSGAYRDNNGSDSP